jgi:nucleotide-binding universal stress UspA family protein
MIDSPRDIPSDAPSGVPDTVPPEWSNLLLSPDLLSLDEAEGEAANRDPDPMTILVAIDQAQSVEVQDTAAKLAVAAMGRVRVLHLREVGPYPSSLETRSEAKALTQAVMERLAALGVGRVTGTVQSVDSRRVAHAIALEAQASAADVIVIGRRWRSALGSLLFGGISRRVLRMAPCPVLVVGSVSRRGAGPPRSAQIAFDYPPDV